MSPGQQDPLTVAGAIPASTVFRSESTASPCITAASIRAWVARTALSSVLAFHHPLKAILATWLESVSDCLRVERLIQVRYDGNISLLLDKSPFDGHNWERWSDGKRVERLTGWPMQSPILLHLSFPPIKL